MRNFLTVLKSITDALNANQDMTPDLAVALEKLEELHSWCPPEGTQPWDQLRDLIRGVAAKRPENLVHYKRILSNSGPRKIRPQGLGKKRRAPEVVEELKAAIQANGDFNENWRGNLHAILTIANAGPDFPGNQAAIVMMCENVNAIPETNPHRAAYQDIVLTA